MLQVSTKVATQTGPEHPLGDAHVVAAACLLCSPPGGGTQPRSSSGPMPCLPVHFLSPDTGLSELRARLTQRAGKAPPQQSPPLEI